MSATCVLRASGKRWFTRSVTYCCCWEVSRSASRPHCVSSLTWGHARLLHSPLSADPSGDLGLLYELLWRSQGRAHTKAYNFNLCLQLWMDKTDDVRFFRMKFLTRKWHKAIRRLSLSATVNGHAPGELSGHIFWKHTWRGEYGWVDF